MVSDIDRSISWSFDRSLTRGLSWNKIKNDIKPSLSVFRADKRKSAEVVAVPIIILVTAVSSSLRRSVRIGIFVLASGEESLRILLVKIPHSQDWICSVVVLKGSDAKRAMAFCWNSR